MKDLPHHMKKLNRKVFRSFHKEELEEKTLSALLEMPSPPNWKQSERQIKKQAKANIRKEKQTLPQTPLTSEEKNKKMLHRVPVFDRLNHAKPKTTKPTRKKTPRI